MTTLSNTPYIDELTGLPNFMKFFTDDFAQVYGNHGHILYMKFKGIKRINEVYGYNVTDEIFKTIATYMKANVFQTHYRNEGNGFTIIFNGQGLEEACGHEEALKSTVAEKLKTMNIEGASLFTLIMPYTAPILSIADYYQLFHDTYLKELELSDGKALMHYLLEKLSFRVNDMISKYTNVRDFALYDEVSNLPNSKSARMYLDEINEACPNYALLFIDGDSLGQFNELSYEHGNTAIREIASVIASSLRKSDKVFRWLSGDEFIVVAKDISCEEVKLLADRIRENVERHCASMIFPATVSIGISMFPVDGGDVHTIISNAEIANKNAKALGKNQSCFHINSFNPM